MKNNKLLVNDSVEQISEYKKTKNHIWLDTNDNDIKVVVF
jgi:predicted nucleotidyltransferase